MKRWHYFKKKSSFFGAPCTNDNDKPYSYSSDRQSSCFFFDTSGTHVRVIILLMCASLILSSYYGPHFIRPINLIILHIISFHLSPCCFALTIVFSFCPPATSIGMLIFIYVYNPQKHKN